MLHRSRFPARVLPALPRLPIILPAMGIVEVWKSEDGEWRECDLWNVIMVIDKDLYGYLSIAIVTIATVPYLIGVVRGKIKPHAFSWLIWALVAGIAAAA